MNEWIEQLQTALSGLTYRSESDYPLEFVHWTKKDDDDLNADSVLKELDLELDSDASVEEGDPAAFLEDCCKSESWFSDEERKMAKDFEKVQALLKQHLQNLKLFRFGEIEIAVVLIGENGSGEVYGFKTTSVET